jgi:hypothetical protein
MAVTDANKEEFTLCIEVFRARDQVAAEYIDEKLKCDGFLASGRFAAYSAQMDALHLPPWVYPPCFIDDADIDKLIDAGDDEHGKHAAAKLVARLRELGISKFHPDPLAAIKTAKRDAAA